ncbi:MAG: D-2-hydroxyacid dehydrogenase, partial [Calditrichaeota bacterium]
MNLVVVDGYTMNPGDLDWSPLTRLLPSTIYDHTLPQQVVDRCIDAQVVVTNKVVFDRRMIERLPKLRCLGVSASGYNIIDLQAAREREICVTNVPAYSTRSVAQMVFAHILRFTQEVDAHSSSVRAGVWSESHDFCFWNSPLIELQGLTLGIIGFGQIARAVAEIGRAFGMNVIFYLYRRCMDAPEWAEQVDLRTLFAQADFISLH